MDFSPAHSRSGVLLSTRRTGAALLAISACAAAAQTTLAPVTVQANRYAQELQSAPFSVSVITAAEIMASGATDANDAIRRLLGIASRTDLRGGRDYSLDLRGFGATADQNLVVVVDGVRISENEQATARLSAIAPESIASIEVVRGASGVQWGEGASAGVINVLLKQGAASGIAGSATLLLESLGGRDARVNLRAGSEQIGLDAVARSVRNDGYRDNGGNRQDLLSVGLVAQADAWKLRLRVHSENQGTRFPGSLTFAQFAANPRQTTTPNDYGDFKETRLSAGAEYRKDAWTLVLDLAQRQRDTSSFFTGFDNAVHSEGTQFSPRLGYAAGFGAQQLTLLAGMDSSRWNYRATSNFGQNERAYQSNQAWYLTADLLAASGTRVVAGARHEKVEKSADDSAHFVNYRRPDSLSAWDFGVNQALGQGFNAYGRVAQAYRLANVDDNRYLFTALKPQVTRDAQLGLKWRNAGGDSASFSYFTQKAKDEIAYDPTNFSNVNLDPTRRSGFELVGRLQLGAAWRLSGSLQTVRARFDAGPNAGLEMPLVSNISAALRLHWAIDARQNLQLGWQQLGQARFADDNANTCASRIPASRLLDTRYSWRMDKLELSLAASNLTDAQSYSQAFSCTTGALYPDPGRTLRAGLSYSF